MGKTKEMDKLMPILEHTFGIVHSIEEVAPGIYFFSVSKYGRCFARECYLVEQENKIISNQAKSYGKRIDGHPNLLVYEVEARDSHYQIIQYEVALYHHKCHNTPETLDELLCISTYGMESDPEYFGEFPAPIDTPRGRTLRSKRIWNGVWCLETDHGERMVAICYPVWNGDISEGTEELGEQTQQDREQGIENTYGYLFFPWGISCIPLFELIWNNPEHQENKTINFSALKNVIWEKYPDYALKNNLEVQKMRQESSKQGIDTSSFTNGLIEYSPNAGLEFLEF